MNIGSLKRYVCKAIDEHSSEIIQLAENIALEPELGFKEYKTAKKVSEFLNFLGIQHQTGIGITGVKANLKEDNKGLTVAILGELDGIICSNPFENSTKAKATHTCGHNLQIAGMLGAALGLQLSGVLEFLDGNVVAIAVPAEEFIEIEHRQRLKEDGKIRFYCGKQELIHLGIFDNIDMSLMFHSLKDTPDERIAVCTTSNGFLAKTVKYSGIAAHAAESPECGINALDAALIGLAGVNAIRGTFLERDNIRVQYIINKGGDVANTIPSNVEIEILVRGSSIRAMRETSEKIDRALIGGAHALGAGITIDTIPGQLPMQCSNVMNEILKENALQLIDEEDIVEYGHFDASTDLGDLSLLMPVIHPFVGGVRGNLHSTDFHVVNNNTAILLPAKLMAMTVIDLLHDQGEKGQEVIRGYKPFFTSQESYLTFIENSFETKSKSLGTIMKFDS